MSSIVEQGEETIESDFRGELRAALGSVMGSDARRPQMDPVRLAGRFAFGADGPAPLSTLVGHLNAVGDQRALAAAHERRRAQDAAPIATPPRAGTTAPRRRTPKHETEHSLPLDLD